MVRSDSSSSIWDGEVSGWSMDVHKLIFSMTVARSERTLASGVSVGGIVGAAAGFTEEVLIFGGG